MHQCIAGGIRLRADIHEQGRIERNGIKSVGLYKPFFEMPSPVTPSHFKTVEIRLIVKHAVDRLPEMARKMVVVGLKTQFNVTINRCGLKIVEHHALLPLVQGEHHDFPRAGWDIISQPAILDPVADVDPLMRLEVHGHRCLKDALRHGLRVAGLGAFHRPTLHLNPHGNGIRIHVAEPAADRATGPVIFVIDTDLHPEYLRLVNGGLIELIILFRLVFRVQLRCLGGKAEPRIRAVRHDSEAVIP